MHFFHNRKLHGFGLCFELDPWLARRRDWALVRGPNFAEGAAAIDPFQSYDHFARRDQVLIWTSAVVFLYSQFAMLGAIMEAVPKPNWSVDDTRVYEVLRDED
ncbi:MAG: hypothetical protein ACI8UO_000759 [Verrucomicrobiales bacterium]